MTPANDNKPTKLVDFKGLKEKHGIYFSRTHLSRLEIEKEFPKRVILGAKRVAWVESEIVAWAAAKIAARDAA
jgi:prophage regulatory protein